MSRTWKDPRDGREWKGEALPMIAALKPGEPVPTFDEVNHTVRFTSGDWMESYITIVPPSVGMRFEDLSDDEMGKLLDEARRGRFPAL